MRPMWIKAPEMEGEQLNPRVRSGLPPQPSWVRLCLLPGPASAAASRPWLPRAAAPAASCCCCPCGTARTAPLGREASRQHGLRAHPESTPWHGRTSCSGAELPTHCSAKLTYCLLAVLLPNATPQNKREAGNIQEDRYHPHCAYCSSF